MSCEDAPLLSGFRSSSGYSSTMGFLKVFMYSSSLTSNPDSSNSQMVFSGGQYSAEELCTAAAKTCGILPVYQSLFALASPDLKTWYNPNYIFIVDGGIAHTVVYRIRFFFPGWIGASGQNSRCSLRNPDPLLSYQVIDYLFAQCRSDFINGRMQVPDNIDVQEQCLALAVLDVMRLAQENSKTPEEILSSISYKHCVPQTVRQNIVKLPFFSRKRLRRRVQSSLRKIRACTLTVPLIKIKYIVEIEKLDPDFGIETFAVTSSQKDSKDLLLRVSGKEGITWKEAESELWQPFCDFADIVDIRITQANSQIVPEGRIVTITKQNNKILEAPFPVLKEALSFVSLIDGYYRLTTDSIHYFCEEVVPPRLHWDLENQCHGPITSDFAISKLKKNGGVAGSYILRRSPQEYEKFLVTVCLETSLGKDYQGCCVQCKNDTFSLAGVPRNFSSLRSLLDYYQNHRLCLGGVSTCLTSCCPPRSKEKSNLIIMRGSCPQSMMSPARQRRNIPPLTFHKIHLKDIAFQASQGKGSFTKIFHGLRRDTDGEEDCEVEVLLKVLDASHQHYQESFLEAASIMNQLSHKHQVLLHGVCVGKQIVMVQEFISLGALDLYLKRQRQKGPIPVSWKLEVVKQLAYALCYMEDKQLVHGNISAKKILLSREGDQYTPPFIKLSDRGVSIKVLDKEMLLERIPWLAPECVSDPRNLALESDCWSFGVTLWEIFNDGSSPINSEEPGKRHQFYKEQMQLPAPHWIELASLEQHCMSYNPALRPSFRVVIRELNNLIASDYELLVDSRGQQGKEGFKAGDRLWEYQDPSVYEERHLKYISILGKGNFGSVELCRYDPLGDNTGELVAVKKLQQSTAEHVRDFHRESLILRALHNDFIVKYKGICYSAGRRSFQLIMEYLPNGSLQEFLPKHRDGLLISQLLLYATQICKLLKFPLAHPLGAKTCLVPISMKLSPTSWAKARAVMGMIYLGSQRYLHRDLASRNILVENVNHVKIGDFGLTKILPQDKEYYVVREKGQSPIFWHAPESLSDNIYSRESDVWSFGVLLYELFSYCERSRSPSSEYRHMMGLHNSQQTVCALVEMLRAGRRLPSPPGCPAQVYNMMLSCWSFNPFERPSFNDLENQCEQLKMIQNGTYK